MSGDVVYELIRSEEKVGPEQINNVPEEVPVSLRCLLFRGKVPNPLDALVRLYYLQRSFVPPYQVLCTMPLGEISLHTAKPDGV